MGKRLLPATAHGRAPLFAVRRNSFAVCWRFHYFATRLAMESNYQQMLRDELLGRLKKNRAYSARAMARDLGLSPAYFCQVLNRSRCLKEDRAYDIADKLNWDATRTHRFVTLLRYERAKDETSRKQVLGELNRWHRKKVESHSLDASYFESVSSWVHYAILELLAVEGFQAKPAWIAKKLGLTLIETEGAIRTLRSLGLLRTDGKVWTKAYDTYTTPDDNPGYAAALRNYHDRSLQLARRRLWDDQTQREFGAIVVATDPALMPEIKLRIREFQDEMMAFMESAPKKAVYQMQIQLFQVDGGKTA